MKLVHHGIWKARVPLHEIGDRVFLQERGWKKGPGNDPVRNIPVERPTRLPAKNRVLERKVNNRRGTRARIGVGKKPRVFLFERPRSREFQEAVVVPAQIVQLEGSQQCTVVDPCTARPS